MKDFSKYLKDGRRVAAFGQQYDNEIEVFLLYCSRKDHFSKKRAKSVYSSYKAGTPLEKIVVDFEIAENTDGEEYVKLNYAHPVVIRIPIKEGDSAQYTFSKYMVENFYRKTYRYYRITVERGFLIKDKEMIQVSQKLEKHRWS
jgi:hypothetical protein